MPEIEHRKVCNDLTLSAFPARLRLAFLYRPEKALAPKYFIFIKLYCLLC